MHIWTTFWNITVVTCRRAAGYFDNAVWLSDPWLYTFSLQKSFSSVFKKKPIFKCWFPDGVTTSTHHELWSSSFINIISALFQRPVNCTALHWLPSPGLEYVYIENSVLQRFWDLGFAATLHIEHDWGFGNCSNGEKQKKFSSPEQSLLSDDLGLIMGLCRCLKISSYPLLQRQTL